MGDLGNIIGLWGMCGEYLRNMGYIWGCVGVWKYPMNVWNVLEIWGARGEIDGRVGVSQACGGYSGRVGDISRIWGNFGETAGFVRGVTEMWEFCGALAGIRLKAERRRLCFERSGHVEIIVKEI